MAMPITVREVSCISRVPAVVDRRWRVRLSEPCPTRLPYTCSRRVSNDERRCAFLLWFTRLPAPKYSTPSRTQYAVGAVGEEYSPNTPATSTWQCRRDFRVTERIRTQRVAAVRTVPLGAACRHLGHADALEMEPFLVALQVVSVSMMLGRGNHTLLSQEIIWP